MGHIKHPLIAAAAIVCVQGTSVAAECEVTQYGQIAFNKHCRTCHGTDAADDRLGPNLHEIIGCEAGTAKGFSYSSALAKSGFDWTPEKLDYFIENPDAAVPGHTMKSYSGIGEPDVRAANVTYLKKQSRSQEF